MEENNLSVRNADAQVACISDEVLIEIVHSLRDIFLELIKKIPDAK